MYVCKPQSLHEVEGLGFGMLGVWGNGQGRMRGLGGKKIKGIRGGWGPYS